MRGASGIVTILPPLRRIVSVRCPRSSPRRFDVSSRRFGDSQPIQRQQADQRVILRASEPGRDEQRADFVAIKARRVRLVVEPRVDGHAPQATPQ